MVLNKPKVVISKGGIHGYCWFAGEDIKAGEWIWKKHEGANPLSTDILVTRKELESWDPKVREQFMSLAYQVDDSQYLGFDPAKPPAQSELEENWVNHSCDGNCWYMNDELLVAMRDIKKGEELCYDYALTEGDEDWVLAPKCLCSAKSCRGLVTGNDWKNPELRKKYGRHFLKFILQRIDNLDRSESAARTHSHSHSHAHAHSHASAVSSSAPSSSSSSS